MANNKALWQLLGGVSGAMAVGFSAYAAHGLKDLAQAQEWVEKASRFQMYHALALFAVAALPAGRLSALAGIFFTLGIVLFCGALYGLALADLPLGRVAPWGGSSFILGWLALAASALLHRKGAGRGD